MKPYHKHDCEHCVYLGSTMTEKPLDWYAHDDTVMARFSDRGSDYLSMPVAHTQDDKYLFAKHGDNQIINGIAIIARFMLQHHVKGK